MSKPEEKTVKTSLLLTPSAKHKLTVLKADLKLKGIHASESDLVCALVMNTSAEAVTRLIK